MSKNEFHPIINVVNIVTETSILEAIRFRQNVLEPHFSDKSLKYKIVINFDGMCYPSCFLREVFQKLSKKYGKETVCSRLLFVSNDDGLLVSEIMCYIDRASENMTKDELLKYAYRLIAEIKSEIGILEMEKKNMSNENEIEQEIQSKNLNAPRITPEQIESVIVSETYTVLPSGKVMICELTLLNGFAVTGEAAVVSKENFNEEIGKQVSRENALNKIWMLEGYLLQEKLHEYSRQKS